MKSKFLIRLSCAACAGGSVLQLLAFPAGAASGVDVKNNFNYGTVTSVRYSRPKPQPRQVQPSVLVQPVMVTQPSVIAQPVYPQQEYRSDAIVPVAYDNEDVRSSVLVRKPEKTQGKHNWYAALKYVQTFSSFSSKHYTDGNYCVGGVWCKDKFAFKPMMGLSVSAGKWYEDWRLELEGGYTGQYSDSADDVKFGISAMYLTLNSLYNFSGKDSDGFYAGPGVGVAFPETEITSGGVDVHFLNDGAKKREVSPTVSLMLGYQWNIGDSFAVDLGYKIWTFSGTKHSRDFQIDQAGVITNHTFMNKTSWLINNSFSFGVRYYF
jgi:opacity protein-like surface antigen